MLKSSIVVKGALIAIVAALAVSSLAFAKGLPKVTPKAATSAPLSTVVMQSDWKSEAVLLKIDNFVLTRVWRALDGIARHLSKRPAGRFGGKLGLTLREVEALLARAQSIVSTHAGFDASGNVTDAAQAQKSVAQVSGILRALRGGLIYRLQHMSL